MVKKKIPFDVVLQSVRPARQLKRPKVFTNDLHSVEFEFTIVDVEPADLATSEAFVYLYMEDGSFFVPPKADVERKGCVFTYILKENEGNHKGIARIQLSVKIPGATVSEDVYFATQKYEFEIENGLETEIAQEVMIHEWSSLNADVRDYLNELADNEDTRQEAFVAAELARDALYAEVQQKIEDGQFFDMNRAIAISIILG